MSVTCACAAWAGARGLRRSRSAAPAAIGDAFRCPWKWSAGPLRKQRNRAVARFLKPSAGLARAARTRSRSGRSLRKGLVVREVGPTSKRWLTEDPAPGNSSTRAAPQKRGRGPRPGWMSTRRAAADRCGSPRQRRCGGGWSTARRVRRRRRARTLNVPEVAGRMGTGLAGAALRVVTPGLLALDNCVQLPREVAGLAASATPRPPTRCAPAASRSTSATRTSSASAGTRDAKDDT